MRLFFALDFPPSVKKQLKQLMDDLAAYAEGGHFTHAENLHLTLVFLGDLPQERLPAVLEALESLKAEGFQLGLSGFGSFERRGGALFWLGVEENSALFHLQRQLSTALEQAGFQLEKRRYKPHITLGREVRLPPSFTAEKLAWEGLSVPIKEVVLMESARISGRLIYRPLAAKSLLRPE